MKHMLISLLAAVLLMAAPAISAAESAVAEMATIVMHLKHYPSAREQESLAQIIADEQATAGEKMLAGALMRMQHRVGGEDMNTLRSLVSDSKAPQPERELADILLGIAHKPSGKDMKRLRLLAE
jgi:hypothetical protein